MSTATVYDLTPAQLQRTVARKSGDPPSAAASFSICDDLADGIEAVHQCANLAGFTERPRAFILALATAAHSHNTDSIELYDAELAELQGCSKRTVQRQRDDYLRESRAKNFDFVEIIEGAFDKEKKRHQLTRYRFYLGDVVERIVAEARSSKEWHETDRPKQRAAIKQAASNVYDEIPNAPTKRRKKKRPRLATAEIETCQKIIETKFQSLTDKASKLSSSERERLMNAVDPGELHEWWLGLRSRMDNFFGVESPQTIDGKADDRDTRQFVVYPPLVVADAHVTEQSSADEAELVVTNTLNTTTTDPEALAAWETLEERLTAPQIRRVEVELERLEPIPPQCDDKPTFDAELGDEATLETADPEAEGNDLELELDPVEQAEREAIQAEANNLPLEPAPSPAAVRLGPAVWCGFRPTSEERPVTVTGDLGLGSDGRRYVSIAESAGGIPFDEISYPADPDEGKPTTDAAADVTSAGVEGSGGTGSPAEPPPDEDIYFPPGISDDEAERIWDSFVDPLRPKGGSDAPG